MQEGWGRLLLDGSDDGYMLIDTAGRNSGGAKQHLATEAAVIFSKTSFGVDLNVGEPRRLLFINVCEFGYFETPVMDIQATN